MIKRALVLLAPGFEEIEAITVIDILRRAGIEVLVAGTVEGPIEGARKVKVLADVHIEQVSEKAFDLVVLPGGQPNTRNLGSDPRVQKILAGVQENEGYLSAICAAPSVRSEMDAVNYSEDRVVVEAE